jgi:hypothetical protein
MTARGNGEFDGPTVGELLALSRRILAELRRREVIKSGNAPAGDYAELLVQQATGGELAPGSQKSWDVETPGSDAAHLQVKARVVTDPKNRSERQLSFFPSWEFDAAVIVLFDDDFRVWKAALLPVKVVKEVAKHVGHVSGWRVFATDELLARGQDWTEHLRKVAK